MIFSLVSAFSLAVILGFSFVSFVSRGNGRGYVTTVLHALLMVSALLLLWSYVMDDSPGPWESMVLVLVAFGSAGVLYAREFIELKMPRWLVVAHGLFSFTGLALLLIAEFSK